MSKVIVITDSTCDLSPEILKQRNIEFLPLKVCFNATEYRDVLDINPAQLFEKVEQLNTLPKSAAATINEFIDVFEKHLEDKENEIIYMGIGSKLSSSYQNAFIAINSLDDDKASRVHLIDSANLSTGIGLQVLKICDLRDQGLSASEIADKMKNITPCVRAQFSVKDLTFLHKGGRCSGTVRLFGHLLHIHPVIKVIDGKLVVYRKPRGKYIKAIDEMLEIIQGDMPNVDLDHVFITHTGAKQEYLDYFYNELIKIVPQSCVEITNAGSVITSHCGYGTIGVLYIKK